MTGAGLPADRRFDRLGAAERVDRADLAEPA